VTDEDRRRLAALGYVGGGTNASLSLPGDTLADPKDKVQVLEKYRRAVDLAAELRFAEATALYREVLKDDPGMTDVWLQLAEAYTRQGMQVEAVGAFKEIIKRNPKDAGALIGAAGGLLRLGRLEEARKHAELAAGVAPAGAHEILAKIAIAGGSRAEALREAALAQEADPTLPMPLYVEGVLAYNAGRYDQALDSLLRARNASTGRPVQMNDLNYYIGDSLARLERYAQAEPYLAEEVRLFPDNLRARAGLAMLYRVMGRDLDAERAVEELLRVSPTPEGRAMAAQLWMMFGEPEKARRVKIPQPDP
jgi:tetratricopeptide (TPR) repeat protein